MATTAKKKGKKGSRGKKGRMTEAEEDTQMLKSAQSKRTVTRLDHQPTILAPHCKMHPYQLEGLNWMVKLYGNNINGILADEMGLVCNSSFRMPFCIALLKVSNCFPSRTGENTSDHIALGVPQGIPWSQGSSHCHCPKECGRKLDAGNQKMVPRHSSHSHGWYQRRTSQV